MQQNIQLKRSHLTYKTAGVTCRTFKNIYGGLTRNKFVFFISSVHIKVNRKHHYVINWVNFLLRITGMEDRSPSQDTHTHTHQLFTHLSQGQELPMESDISVDFGKSRTDTGRTCKIHTPGIEPNTFLQRGECGAPPRWHRSQCLHSVQTVQHVHKQEIGTNLFDTTVYLLIFHWSSTYLLTEFSVAMHHPLFVYIISTFLILIHLMIKMQLT